MLGLSREPILRYQVDANTTKIGRCLLFRGLGYHGYRMYNFCLWAMLIPARTDGTAHVSPSTAGNTATTLAYRKARYFSVDECWVIVDSQKLTCKRWLCSIQTKGWSTSNLVKHLKDRHSDLFKEFKASELQFSVTYVMVFLTWEPAMFSCIC